MKRRAAGYPPKNRACLNQYRIGKYFALPRTSEAWVRPLAVYISLGNPFFPFQSDLLRFQGLNKRYYDGVIETENAKKVKRFFLDLRAVIDVSSICCSTKITVVATQNPGYREEDNTWN